jgi:hypothetical protein
MTLRRIAFATTLIATPALAQPAQFGGQPVQQPTLQEQSDEAVEFSISHGGVLHFGPGVTLRDAGKSCSPKQHEIATVNGGQAVCKSN